MSERRTGRLLTDGVCGKCGHEIVGAPVSAAHAQSTAQVRCADCGGITTTREFRPFHNDRGDL